MYMKILAYELSQILSIHICIIHIHHMLLTIITIKIGIHKLLRTTMNLSLFETKFMYAQYQLYMRYSLQDVQLLL